MRLIDDGRDSGQFALGSTLAAHHWGAAAMGLVLALYFYWDEGRLAELHGTARHIPLLIFALAFAVLSLGWRRGVTVAKDDAAESSVIQVRLWWGFGFPMFHRAASVTPQAVVLERAVIQDTNPTYVSTIFLLNSDGPAQFVGRFNDIVRAHAVAQHLAEFLGVELHDCSAEVEFRVSAFGFLRWNADRQRSRWYYAFDANGKPVLRERSSTPI